MFTQGSTPALFVGTAAFEVIVKQQIKRLEDPALKCCQLVYDELIRILGQLLTKIVRRLTMVFLLSPKCAFCMSLASIPSVPSVARALQQRRRQFLQELDGANNETCIRYGRNAGLLC
jgi:hypothetical protein